jgi:hypothetical protein
VVICTNIVGVSVSTDRPTKIYFEFLDIIFPHGYSLWGKQPAYLPGTGYKRQWEQVSYNTQTREFCRVQGKVDESADDIYQCTDSMPLAMAMITPDENDSSDNRWFARTRYVKRGSVNPVF